MIGVPVSFSSLSREQKVSWHMGLNVLAKNSTKKIYATMHNFERALRASSSAE
jgi:hypothetical protein